MTVTILECSESEFSEKEKLGRLVREGSFICIIFSFQITVIVMSLPTVKIFQVIRCIIQYHRDDANRASRDGNSYLF